MLNYQSPVMKSVPLALEQTILNASHEIIPVIPVNPGFTYESYSEEWEERK